MQTLSSLNKIVEGKNKRRGRGYGSGKGAKASRGTKRHQKAREKIPIWFEGGQNRMVKKFPLLRGKSKNKSVREQPIVIQLHDIAQMKAGTEVTVALLIKEKIVSPLAEKIGVKILSKGAITTSLTVVVPVSKNTRLKIESAGGTVEN